MLGFQPDCDIQHNWTAGLKTIYRPVQSHSILSLFTSSLWMEAGSFFEVPVTQPTSILPNPRKGKDGKTSK